MNTPSKTAKPKSRNPVRKVKPAVSGVNRRRELRLKLPLNAEVEGRLAGGGTFRERTRLENISSGGAFFTLNSGVVVGSRFDLVIELPAQLTEGRKLEMRLGGTIVRLVRTESKSRKQGVAVRFTKEFEIVPAAKTAKKK